MADKPTDTENEWDINRRRFLVASGAAGIAGIAGCAGDGDGSDDTTTAGDDDTTMGGGDDTTTAAGGGEPIDPAYTQDNEGSPPDNPNFNHYNPLGAIPGGDGTGYAHDQLAIFNDSQQEWIGVVATDWSVADGTMTVETYENHQFQNGDPVTADDIVTGLTIDKHYEDPLWNLVNDVQATGDNSFELTLQTPNLNPRLVEDSLFQLGQRWVFTNENVYGEDRTALEEATTDDEVNNVLADISNRIIGPDRSQEVCSGMFVYDEKTTQYTYWTLSEDYENQHMSASDLSFDQVEVKYNDSRQQQMTAWSEGVTDGGAVDGQPSFWEPILEEDWMHTKVTPLDEGHGLNFNFDDPVFGNRNVRQAISYVLDRELISENAPYMPQSTPTIEWQVGLVNPLVEEYVDTSGFIDYRNASDPLAKAEQLMQEAGFSKQGDTWTGTIDGEGLDATVKIPPYWEQQGTTAADQLNQFGIPVETLVQEGSTFWQDQDNANFRIASSSFGGGYHPWVAYSSLQGFSAQRLNYPREVQVPPVGEPDAESTMTVNIDDELDALRTATGDEVNEITTRLAWVWNVDAPYAQYFDFVELTGYTSDDWDVPDVSEEPRLDCNVVTTWQFKSGIADARTE